MKVRVFSDDIQDVAADILVVGLFEGVKRIDGATKKVDEILGGAIARALKKNELKGKLGESMVFTSEGRLKSERVLVVGLGSKEKFSLDKVRHLSLYPVNIAKKLRKKHLATVIWGQEDGGSGLRGVSRFLTLGYLLSNYSYDKFKEEKAHRLDILTIVEGNRSSVREINKGIFEAQGIASGINFARDLVNAPPAYLRPDDLAKEAAKLSKGKIRVRVYREKEIQKMGMRGLYAVGMGSTSPPRLIVAQYRGGREREKPIAVVGKGVTFDTGGISLKKWEGMDKMKYDMAGAAAALGTLKAISKLGLKKNVMVVVPVAENMPSGNAFRPGDIIRMMSGKTVEVLSTDAEGRLILGDAIHFAKVKGGARAIIDIATLTGACVVALGSIPIGMMGNDKNILDKFAEAVERSGERAWELPLFEEYGEQIKSEVADIKNLGGFEAGAITAGYFLSHFVGDVPWVHLDIAGVAWRDKEKLGYMPGATGAGVRLITEVIMHYD
jgi:leucyl aminopeptidase